MKTLAFKLARIGVAVGYELVKLADDYVFFLETGKTYAEHIREVWGKLNVPAHEAKQQFLEQKKKGTVN